MSLLLLFNQPASGGSGGSPIAFTSHGPYLNVPAAGAAITSDSISYTAGQPIIVEAGSSDTLTIADTAGLTWQLLDASLPLYFAANGEYQYVWYAIPASSGTTSITVTRASSGSYYGFVVATYQSGAGTPLLKSTGSVGSYTASATPFSNTITPTTSGSAVWTSYFTGGGSGPPTMDSGSAIYSSLNIAGNRTAYRLGKDIEPLTSSAAVTISGQTDTGFQYAQWINYEVPGTSVGSGGGAVITCAVGAAAAAGVSAQVSATLATAVGAASAAGVSAQVSTTLATAVGASTATGAGASIITAGSTVITCTVGSAAAAGVSAQLSATIATAVGAASATGASASISAAGSTVIPCTVAAAIATGASASISIPSSTVITCAVGAASAVGVSAGVSATLATVVSAASATGTSANISTPGSTSITCLVGDAAAVGASAQVSATIRTGVGTAAAAGFSAATGLRLAATVGEGAAIGLLAQLPFRLSTGAGESAATGVPYIPRSSNDILPGALVGIRPFADITRPAKLGAERPARIARTTR